MDATRTRRTRDRARQDWYARWRAVRFARHLGFTRASLSSTRAERQRGLSPEAENFRRWKGSGQARAWVVAHNGRWDHQDWLTLLEELKRSPFWPMPPAAVGSVLEEAKRAWLQRN